MKWLRIVSLSSAALLAACSSDASRSADTAAAVDTTGVQAVAGGDTAVAAPATAGGMLDPNAASSTDLVAIPGVTQEIAAAIVAGRPYTSMTAVDRVLAASLSEQQRDSVYARLWIPIDLNTASGEEILLIPGIGARMRREFEEYRPYRSMAQFRREIGKYVDDDEVARLERYVMIR